MISFGNLESDTNIQYYQLGIIPTALKISILNSDSEDVTRKKIAEFLTNCDKDETIIIIDQILGKIKLVKDNKLQRIDIHFYEE